MRRMNCRIDWVVLVGVVLGWRCGWCEGGNWDDKVPCLRYLSLPFLGPLFFGRGEMIKPTRYLGL